VEDFCVGPGAMGEEGVYVEGFAGSSEDGGHGGSLGGCGPMPF
jgi:hypothetical protein